MSKPPNEAPNQNAAEPLGLALYRMSINHYLSRALDLAARRSCMHRACGRC
jgi:hypothetical protein